jgi:hypothetical protein
MSKLEETARIIEAIHRNVSSAPDDLEIDRVNGLVLSQMLSAMCDIAVSLAVIADNTRPNIEEVKEDI